MVSHGNPLRSWPARTKAHRRSPATPCHPTSTRSSASGAIDLTGYRHSAATRPTSRPVTRGLRNEPATVLTCTWCLLVRGALAWRSEPSVAGDPVAAPLGYECALRARDDTEWCLIRLTGR